ncbi:uncharacterized protein BDR25DRAFT_301884 [Lindgomyces ingoldianus]|uniref:Uncharacterized protein n=1 Tax=Lindgomyces ingoldianus TaxID=673940 RepID=A0ACB6R3A7_9PLEO|nr:uncharacterized protein BDR25DRAFT_301884 [Lindgomyces ingoldianus]KAF2473763.1 hypothetical protein BDR25DRAFT_301884 [Lindgomyces ingoldianus]
MCPPLAINLPLSETPDVKHAHLLDFVPHSEISKAAFELASRLLPPSILNHSIRVYLYAHFLTQPNSIYSSAKQDLLFAACILHDIGIVPQYDGHQRFEVEGADSAAEHLRRFDVKEGDIHDVWVAIALHTSPVIAERISELARIVREAVLIDFGKRKSLSSGNRNEEDLMKLREGFEEKYPRLGVEKVLGDAVVEQAVRHPEKAPPASWPGILYRAHLADPGWGGVNRAF